MKYIKFTYVTLGEFPAVAGLQFIWARESAYPTDAPCFFGICPDDSDTRIEGVLGVFNQADWEQMRSDEMQARPDSERSVRERRRKVLSNCDWTQASDAPVDKTAWAAYRQALRDIPLQASFPASVAWPTQPE